MGRRGPANERFLVVLVGLGKVPVPRANAYETRTWWQLDTGHTTACAVEYIDALPLADLGAFHVYAPIATATNAE